MRLFHVKWYFQSSKVKMWKQILWRQWGDSKYFLTVILYDLTNQFHCDIEKYSTDTLWTIACNDSLCWSFDGKKRIRTYVRIILITRKNFIELPKSISLLRVLKLWNNLTSLSYLSTFIACLPSLTTLVDLFIFSRCRKVLGGLNTCKKTLENE